MEELLGGKFRMEISDRQFRLSTDSMVLADFFRIPPRARVLDLGCGCGTLGLLICGKEESCQLTGVEIQPDAAACAQKNAENNGLSHRFTIIPGDLREYSHILPANGFDAVLSNPPYYPAESGKQASEPSLAAARSEVCCTLADLCRCAAYSLRWGGSFTVVHKPERLADLICALRAERLEPKRIRFVRHRTDSAVSLVLLESRLGGKPGLGFEPDLILFAPDGIETSDCRRIYHTED